jgi:hypothetical protein
MPSLYDRTHHRVNPAAAEEGVKPLIFQSFEVAIFSPVKKIEKLKV